MPALLKTEILESLRAALREHWHRIDRDLAALRLSQGGETKSSAGDKHETGRAHMQREIDQLLEQGVRVKTWLSAVVDPANPPLYVTGLGIFLIAIPFGKLDVADEKIMVISGASPMGQALLTAESPDHFSWRGDQVEMRLTAE